MLYSEHTPYIVQKVFDYRTSWKNKSSHFDEEKWVKSGNRFQRTEARGQKTEDEGRRTGDGGREL
jgi:hypothetical protein